MSIENITQTIDELYQTEGIEACVLYRIDGTPILVKGKKRSQELLKVMNWMENQIKFVINEIKEKDLEDLKFTLRDKKVYFHPSSRSTVIATIINKEAHQKLISIEISRARNRVEESIKQKS